MFLSWHIIGRAPNTRKLKFWGIGFRKMGWCKAFLQNFQNSVRNPSYTIKNHLMLQKAFFSFVISLLHSSELSELHTPFVEQPA